MREWLVECGRWLCLLVGAICAVCQAANDVDRPPVVDTTTVPPHPSALAMAALGKRMFFDPSLSASGRLACATCHNPQHAFGPGNARASQLGGRDLRQEGVRAVPTLRYLQRVPSFSEHFYDEDFDESLDAGPTGGLTWDGRAQSAHDQARLPLLSPLEMANASPASVVAALEHSSYSVEFRRTFGESIFHDTKAAFRAAVMALEVYQQTPEEFYPYTSKYDAFLRGQTHLSRQERRGLAVFDDPRKGNCAHCHPSAIGSSGAFPAFTDFGYAALAAPRNRELAANRDPGYFDFGLCGPLRTDLADHKDYCGMFRAPTLRNVTLRRVFFHNGEFHSLRRVLEFYADRDIHPDKWYSRDARGKTRQYDDLPPEYHRNVDREPPFDRNPGDRPALSAQDISDLIAFLGTLTDGWSKDSRR